MSWDGAGNFNRLFSWVADKAAGLDISSSRMDSDTNNIAGNGFGNCLTRDGQGQPTANLPMATFRHTGVGNAVNRTDYAALGQVQDGLIYWSTDTGSSTAYAITLTPALTALADGQLCYMRAANANTTTTPTFAPSALTAHTITKIGGTALALNDILANQECELRYNLANTRWELLNPSNSNAINQATAQTGVVWMTIATSPPTGWLMFDDGTFGSASSGSSNSNSALNQSLFTLMFNNMSDTNAPILTSGGGATTRAGQGTAAAAWAANCRMTLPKTLGRALGVAGAGSGLTSRALGVAVGAETQSLGTSNLPAYTPTGSITTTMNAPNQPLSVFANGGSFGFAAGSNANGNLIANTSFTSTFTGTAQGGTATAFSIMQPETFFNAIIKQ